MADRKKIAIIGSGFGGLSAAINLSQDFEVHVFEKNSEPGGKAGEINKNGFRFDTGPSLLTIPSILKNTFKYQDENINDYLEIKQLEKLCRYFYPDGTILNGYAETTKLAEEIESKTLDSGDSIKKYFKYTKRIYDISAEIFLYNSLNEFQTYSNFNAVKSILKLPGIDAFKTVHQANKKYFKDPKTVQIFDRFATYSGSNPYKAPATLNVIPYVEYILGGFIVKGGIYSIVKALYSLAIKKGVRFHFNSDVKEIIFDEKIIKGIHLSEEGKEKIFESEVVVSNADAEFTKTKLIGNINKKRGTEASSSAIVFYWGIKGNYPGLEIHNILFSEDYKKEFREIFEEKLIPSDPTVYIYISSKFNKDDAPDGFENWFVMINTSFIANQDWSKEIDRAKNMILQKIKNILKIDLNDKIVFEECLTPELIEAKTNSFKGSIYGISSNSKTSAFLRQGNKSNKYKGLYFCGGSAHPGGGIPLTLQSGKIAADLIKKYEL